MYYLENSLAVESIDGEVSKKYDFIFPTFTASEAVNVIASLGTGTYVDICDLKTKVLTSEGSAFLEYGFKYSKAPFLTCYIARPSSDQRANLDGFLSFFQNMYDITDDISDYPVGSVKSGTTYHPFDNGIAGDLNHNGNFQYTSSTTNSASMFWSSSKSQSSYEWSGVANVIKYSNNAYMSGIMVGFVVDDKGSVIELLVFTLSTSGNTLRLNLTTSSAKSKPQYWDLYSTNFDFDKSKKTDPSDENDDPYSGAGESGEGGGSGTFDDSSDAVDIPDLPSTSAVDAGFITLFAPTQAQLKSLASYMWSDLFDLDAWRKIFADPMDAILGLSIVPVRVPDSGTGEVKVGNIGTGVMMTKASTQYVAVDCGSLKVKEASNSCLDYSPYTKAEIYLPYIGSHAIDIDDIMGKEVRVVYHVDILSGACCAYVKCGDSVLYNYIGQCASSIPITGDNWTNVINGVLNIAGSIGTMVATGGASAPLAVGSIASTVTNSMKPTVEKSGSMSGTGGMMGIQKPYLMITRPRVAIPKNQNRYIGYPSFMTVSFGDLSGYTEIEEGRFNISGATEAEYNEIVSLLKSGVVF